MCDQAGIATLIMMAMTDSADQQRRHGVSRLRDALRRGKPLLAFAAKFMGLL